MIAQERRLSKLETTAKPAQLTVIRQIEPETLEQAWRRQKGDAPMPPERDLLVIVRTFVSPLRNAHVPAA